MVLVIQSQRNSYHARRGHQRKAEILQQAAGMGQVTERASEDIYWSAINKKVMNLMDKMDVA